MSKVTYKGKEFDFDAAFNLMDVEICEVLAEAAVKTTKNLWTPMPKLTLPSTTKSSWSTDDRHPIQGRHKGAGLSRHPRTSQGYALGEYPVPEPVAKLVRLCVKLKLSPDDVIDKESFSWKQKKTRLIYGGSGSTMVASMTFGTFQPESAML
jgi:hypothetical protein